MQVRRIDDQLAAFFNNASEFVTGLAAYPELVVVLVKQGDDATVLATRVLDVDLPANFGGAAKCLTKVAGKQRMRAQPIVIVSGQHGIQRDDLRRHKVGGSFNHVAGRSLDSPNNVLDTGQRAEPVRRVGEVRPGDAGKEIFGASRKTGNFVRHRGAENQYGVVNSRAQAAVQIYLHGIVD